MRDTEASIGHLEEALKGLVKLIKADRFYPPGHPALRIVAEQSTKAFAPLLGGSDPLTFAVRKEGFFLEEKAVAPGNPHLQKFAHSLFARRIHRLLILPDLSPGDLRSFARCLRLPPSDIQARGGIQEVLRRLRVSTLWVNETDLADILSRKENIEVEKEAVPETGMEWDEVPPLAPATGARDLASVLEEIERTQDDGRFQSLLQELVPLATASLSEAGRPQILRTFILLCINASGRNLSAARREHARQALSALTGEETVNFLADFLCSRGLDPKVRENLLRVLAFLRERATRHLMNRLADEDDAASRRTLAEALIRQGTTATHVLLEFLGDERWYVVRNTVAILGEIRDQKTAIYLTAHLQHPDMRVRREAIRALTRIGGASAIGILLQAVEGDDQDLRRQALLSLGAMKSPAAVPTLLKLVMRHDPRFKHLEETKEAIKALGEIGSAEAIPALLAILRQRSFFRRAQLDEVRATAVLALGEIGSPDPLAALESAIDDRSKTVARAAVQAVKQIRKGETHESGTV